MHNRRENNKKARTTNTRELTKWRSDDALNNKEMHTTVQPRNTNRKQQ